MGTYARTRRSANLPVCIFPKGKKAGIRCVTLKVVKSGGRTVKLCDEPNCTYANEETGSKVKREHIGAHL